MKKWPGVITAFDCLLKADSFSVLAERMRRFFRVALAPERAAIVALAEECGCDEDQRVRLEYLCKEASRNGLKFSEKCIKPVFAGSIPAGHDWYPPTEYAHWIYYEPLIKIPRNVNPGKNSGWGWMQQWRDPESHEVFPKLIFTTSANKNYGFRAYVVPDGWYTKLHGAASQQYHYVALSDPMRSRRLDGRPNNLSAAGEALLSLLRHWGLVDEDMLHLIAAFHNSEYARMYAAREEESVLPMPEIQPADRAVVTELVAVARQLRDLGAIRESAHQRAEPFPTMKVAARIGYDDLESHIQQGRSRVDRLVADLVGSG